MIIREMSFELAFCHYVHCTVVVVSQERDYFHGVCIDKGGTAYTVGEEYKYLRNSDIYDEISIAI